MSITRGHHGRDPQRNNRRLNTRRRPPERLQGAALISSRGGGGENMSKAYICPSPGCYGIVETSGRYCRLHSQYQAAKDARSKVASAARWTKHRDKIDYDWVWHDPRWRALRAAHLKAEPLCARCGAEATIVDHVIPHRGNEDLAFDPGNLQSLCATHSAVKSREDRG